VLALSAYSRRFKSTAIRVIVDSTPFGSAYLNDNEDETIACHLGRALKDPEKDFVVKEEKKTKKARQRWE
jgi:hypothetical protein